MKTHVDKETFVDTFDRYGRGNQFSRAAREALFGYYEQLEDDLGEEIEFDCIAICCDWSEYESPCDATDDLTNELFNNQENALFYLQENSQVIEFDGGILVAAF